MTVEDIVGKSRGSKVRIARQIFCYIASQNENWIDTQIGAVIDKDRTSVVHSRGVVKTMLEIKEPEYTALVKKLLTVNNL